MDTRLTQALTRLADSGTELFGALYQAVSDVALGKITVEVTPKIFTGRAGYVVKVVRDDGIQDTPRG